MAITSFKGVIPVEDYGELNRTIRDAATGVVKAQRSREAYNEQKQKEATATYMKLADTKPEFTMSSYWQKEQIKNTQEFVDFAAKKYQEYNNNPPMQVLAEIQQHKTALWGWQQQLKASQDKYLQAQKEIQKDPLGTKYDKAHFDQKVKNWVETGELGDDLLLPPKVGDIGSYLKGMKWTSQMNKNTTIDGKVQTTIESIPEDKKKAILIDKLYTDPSLKRSALEEFSKLPEQEKKMYLDKNTGELDNPADAIKDWFTQKYLPTAFTDITATKPYNAPKERGGTQTIVGDINTEAPTDKMMLYTRKGKTKGEKAVGDVDVWGTYSLPVGISATITGRPYFDMETGRKTSAQKFENDILLKNIEVKYLPMAGSEKIIPNYEGEGGRQTYLDANGNLKGGYGLKAVLITRPEGEDSKGIELTPEIKDKLKVKFPKYAEQIDGIPLEIKPKGKPVKQETQNSVPSFSRDYLRQQGYSDRKINEAIKQGKIKVK